MNASSRRRLVRQITIYGSALVVFVLMAFPLYGLLLTSLQPETVIRSRDVQFLPSTLYFEHFRAVLAPGHIVPLREGILNSLLVSILTAAVCLIVALPAAYALSRLRVPGKNAMLVAMVSVYFLPTTIFLIPMFVLFVSWGINDTFLSLVLAYSGFILPFEIWILKTFIDRLPREVEDAARIDGCTHMQVMRHVVLPMVRPGIMAGFIFAFILSWIEFLTPLIFTSDIKISTVALGMFRSTIDIEVGQQAAAAVLTLLPVALLMIVFQRLITQVLMAGADR
ncbi:MAG: carbohydrate ABC transporter permease [Roseitalea porphyridii]|jgi:ABC-type glycerol-3-phosphate transport system permease component|uniref:carbohydrate ABC transporter permease n=1 Tax=Roseitalea porphyridii TaxID=1852022 RepID=UPI0032EB4FF9